MHTHTDTHIVQEIQLKKKKIFSRSRNLPHKVSRESKQFCCWISMKPECDARHRQSAKRPQRWKEIARSRLHRQIETIGLWEHFQDKQ